MSPVVIKIDFVDLQSTVYKAVYQEIWAFSKWMEKEGKTFFFCPAPMECSPPTISVLPQPYLCETSDPENCTVMHFCF